MRKTLLTSIALAVVVWPIPAFASCVELPPLEESFAQAPVVFSGTVIDVANGGRMATVEVETVWKGEVPSQVTVLGGPDMGPNITTSVDRVFDAGVSYVFFPNNASIPFQDDACTATAPATTELEVLVAELAGGPGSPPIADPVEDAESEDPSSVRWVITGAVGTLLVVGFSLMVRKRSTRVKVEGFRLR